MSIKTGLRRRALAVAALAAVALLCGCSGAMAGQPAQPPSVATSTPTAPDHVVVVVMENHTFDEVLRAPGAPYLHQLVRSGKVLTRLSAITHPSQPNYLALFSGSTHGIGDDSCPHTLDAANLGSDLRSHGYTFVGYAEGLPRTGWTGCTHGAYARKHAPWVNFTDLPADTSRPMTAFPTNYDRLPTVSFVIPDLQHDLHDGTLAQADAWLRTNLAGYVTWAKTHNSLLILTADENDGSDQNLIPGLVVGQHVAPGRDNRPYTLYSLLRTIENWYGLPPRGHSATAEAIRGLRVR